MHVIPFGKYRGRTYAEIARVDPAYLNWIVTTLTGRRAQHAAEALSERGVELTRTK
jgi:rhodanese-related sulfurtransferase